MTAAWRSPSGEACTVGVEEEYQVLDARTGALASRGAEVLARAQRLLAGCAGAVQGELPLSQVECATSVCTELADVTEELEALRRTFATAADGAGCVIAASSTPPLGKAADQATDTTDERYEQLRADAALLVDEQFIAGMHVHVGMADRERGVAVLDRTRPWLPVLVALSANSPYWLGTDTGYASYRTVHWGRWPVSGPPPQFGTAQRYDALYAQLLGTGAIRDPGHLYWQARLSARHPTVEFRAADVLVDPADAATLAGLHRALAARALADLDAGLPVPDVSDAVLRAASWQAARYGMTADLVVPGTCERRPAGDVARQLVEHVGVHLAEDADRVGELVQRMSEGGTGAERQRDAYARGGFPAVIELIITGVHSTG